MPARFSQLGFALSPEVLKSIPHLLHLLQESHLPVLSENDPDHTCMRTCIRTGHMHMCTHMYIHMHTCAHRDTCTYIAHAHSCTYTHMPAHVHTRVCTHTLSPSFPLFPTALATDLHAVYVYLAGHLSGASWSVHSRLGLPSLQCRNTDQAVFVGWMDFRLLQRNGSTLGLVAFLHVGCCLRQSSRKGEEVSRPLLLKELVRNRALGRSHNPWTWPMAIWEAPHGVTAEHLLWPTWVTTRQACPMGICDLVESKVIIFTCERTDTTIADFVCS